MNPMTAEQACRSPEQGKTLKTLSQLWGSWKAVRADMELVQPLALRMVAERMRSGLQPQFSITVARPRAVAIHWGGCPALPEGGFGYEFFPGKCSLGFRIPSYPKNLPLQHGSQVPHIPPVAHAH